ncbi:GA-like domain-containing protein [Clostridium cellulovorans]|uniref:Minor extracellular protease Epr GA-like domain-containing protein n=1 Tax=Clostridium cellulovorans (strain ATCC 35296 / DSM 3052 / OCM 3 / 743B) TaxID=573061 RepID=D9STR8_CLOC7|nr:hypothetical protein [Clostridium cellulovorans]ADL52802.1 hypothetical protein Clocel_3112 [Clostridium cellulovorans 743B]
MKYLGKKMKIKLITDLTIVATVFGTVSTSNLILTEPTYVSALENSTAYEDQLATATAAVVKAEESKLQVDINSAKTLVNALSNVTDKSNLLKRLTVVQTYTTNLNNATTKVINLETTRTQANVTLAQTAINLLPVDDEERVSLQNRLDVVKTYLIAEASVVKAEKSSLREDVYAATVLINDLTNDEDKMTLFYRLIKVDTYINNLENATANVVEAENNKIQENVDSAQESIDRLPTGDAKRTALQTRLNAVKTYIDYQGKLNVATEAVVKAEESKLQADVNSAKTLVNALSNVTDKTNLLNRLTAVQTYITYTTNLNNATTKVEAAETTRTLANVNLAQTAVNLLPSGDEGRISLQNRLDIVKAYVAAEASVVKAEGSKLQETVDAAKVLINGLTNDADKTTLLNRLAKVEDYIANLANATAKVVEAENNKTQENVDLAQADINMLPVGDAKRTALQTRLNAVKTYIDYQGKLKIATDAVVKAEESKLQADVNSAKTLVNALSNVTDKTNLLNRLTAVQTYITYTTNLNNATTKVEAAETTRTLANVNLAQTAINLLPAGDEKVNLQTRLDVVKSSIA